MVAAGRKLPIHFQTTSVPIFLLHSDRLTTHTAQLSSQIFKMSQLISILLALLFLTSFSSSSPFQTTLSILPTSSSLFFSSSASSPPTPFCVPLPAASSAPSSKPSYWEVHAWSTVGGMLGWFGAICGGLLVVVFPCLAQWRMVELQESLKDSDLPSAVRKRRQKMLTEHYELLDRGVAPWLWHQFRPVISVLLRGLSWPPRKIWDGIKGGGCVVPVVSSLFNKLRRKRTVGPGAGRSVQNRGRIPLGDWDYRKPNYAGN